MVRHPCELVIPLAQCIGTDGALSPDGERWLTPPRRGFLFPSAALPKVFRGKYLDLLTDAHRASELRMSGDEGPDHTRGFECLKASCNRTNGSSTPRRRSAAPPTFSPTSGADPQVRHRRPPTRRLRWRARALPMTLDAGEFISRFLLHGLPRGFTRLRHYRLLANRGRARKLALCRDPLVQPEPECASRNRPRR